MFDSWTVGLEGPICMHTSPQPQPPGRNRSHTFPSPHRPAPPGHTRGAPEQRAGLEHDEQDAEEGAVQSQGRGERAEDAHQVQERGQPPLAVPLQGGEKAGRAAIQDQGHPRPRRLRHQALGHAMMMSPKLCPLAGAHMCTLHPSYGPAHRTMLAHCLEGPAKNKELRDGREGGGRPGVLPLLSAESRLPEGPSHRLHPSSPY